MYRILFPLSLLACSSGNSLTIEFEDPNGDKLSVTADDDSKGHLYGYVNVVDEETDDEIYFTFLEFQPGQYETTGGGQIYSQGIEFSAERGVTISVEATWTGRAKRPFSYDVSFVEGNWAIRNTNDEYQVVGGGMTVTADNCKDGYQGHDSAECGHTHSLENHDGSAEIPMSAALADVNISAPVCSDELVSQFYDGGPITLTESSADLGESSLKCIETAEGHLTCGANGSGKADDCKWDVVIWAEPNNVSGNSPFRMIFAAGGECGEEKVVCRSLYYSEEFSWY